MKNLFKGQRGVSMLTAIMLLLLLSALGLAVVSLVMVESQISVNHLYGMQAFYVAEAGIERAIRAIRDDTAATQTANPAADGYCVTPCVDGYVAPARTGLTNPTYALFYSPTMSSTTRCTLGTTVGYYLQVYDFQQRYNLCGTPIKAMEIGIRAARASGGTNTVIQLQYILNGTTNPTWTSPTNVGSTVTILVTDTEANPRFEFRTFAVPPNWNDLMAVSGADFRIRALRTSGNRNTYIDYLCIRVTQKTDAVTEPWYTTFKDAGGNPITVNFTLGNGVVESLPIDDEAGKVHLNYATQSLLRYLMDECGILDATSNTLATNIVAYRGTNWFDSIEEVMQVTGMTSAYYDLIKDYITVYPWVNPNVQRTTGNRAPININTAPVQVLEAVFDPLGLAASDPATLANAIITRRATTPFASMISSNSTLADPNSIYFARFLDAQAYLTAAQRNAVKENCDASLYNLTQATSWTGGNVTTTEFCYYSTAYSVTAKGKVEENIPPDPIKVIPRKAKRVFKDDGTFNITALWGPTLNYWREVIP